MCGITGFFNVEKLFNVVDILDNMTDSMIRRGPDSRGVKIIDSNLGVVGLGHRRLAILDLSDLGNQPMEYKNYTLVFNGEIYNFIEIKNELIKLGHSFISDTDTEVILHAYFEWGFSSVEKFIGMFAFAIFDSKLNTINFCRDRAGVKPLFIYHIDGVLIFGSELRSILKHPKFKKELDQKSVELYLNNGYVPAPYSIYKDTQKAQSGCWTIFDCNSYDIKVNEYWSLKNFYYLPKLNISFDDAKNKVHKLLVSSCMYRMVADVPVGIFLSGGYDSSLVAAILQSNNKNENLQTFTIGFWQGNDEAPFAKEIAKYLKTNHTDYYCTEEDAKSIIPELPIIYDEPNADISNIPTILVSRLAKKDVKVALSADGGDELFAGYTGFRKIVKDYEIYKTLMPKWLIKTLTQILEPIFKIFPDKYVKLFEALRVLNSSLDDKKFINLVGQYTLPPQTIVENILGRKTSVIHPYIKNSTIKGFHDEVDFLLLNSYDTIMIDLLLVKVDKATMSCGLEGREPFLDHRIAELAAQLPYKFKSNDTEGKLILKSIMHDYIPKELMDRPKTGFDLPLHKWLCTDLRFLVDEVLSEQSIKKVGVFNYNYIKKFKEMGLSESYRYKDLFWRVINFQLWAKNWL